MVLLRFSAVFKSALPPIPFLSRSLILSGLSALTAALLYWGSGLTGLPGTMPSAYATQLPPAVRAYLIQKDPQVGVRFDGLIEFANGTQYLPILPQDPKKLPLASKMIFEDPAGGQYPDIVEFDNHLFLVRLIPTTGGKVTLPVRATYPIALKEGLLPQDILFPPNLVIPSELKVLLGAIPYPPPKPKPQTAVDPKNPTATSTSTTPLVKPMPQRTTLFVADVGSQSVIAYDPIKGKADWKMSLDCLPSSISVDPTGQDLFVACLTTNEILRIDISSNLIKTRIPVGIKPVNLLYIKEVDKLLVSNRFSKFLNVIDPKDFTKTQQVDLPATVQGLFHIPGSKYLYAADYNSEKIYEIDITSWSVRRSLKGLPQVTSFAYSQTPYPDRDKKILWMTSRSSGSVIAVDAETGETLNTFTLEGKPMDLWIGGQGHLFILSSEANKVFVIDIASLQLQTAIPLNPGTFPLKMIGTPDGEIAYITSANDATLHQINLRGRFVEKVFPLDARGFDIALVAPFGVEDKRHMVPRAAVLETNVSPAQREVNPNYLSPAPVSSSGAPSPKTSSTPVPPNNTTPKQEPPLEPKSVPAPLKKELFKSKAPSTSTSSPTIPSNPTAGEPSIPQTVKTPTSTTPEAPSDPLPASSPAVPTTTPSAMKKLKS